MNFIEFQDGLDRLSASLMRPSVTEKNMKILFHEVMGMDAEIFDGAIVMMMKEKERVYMPKLSEIYHYYNLQKNKILMENGETGIIIGCEKCNSGNVFYQMRVPIDKERPEGPQSEWMGYIGFCGFCEKNGRLRLPFSKKGKIKIFPGRGIRVTKLGFSFRFEEGGKEIHNVVPF